MSSCLTEDLERVIGRDVSRETLGRLHEFERLLRDEAANQNLIAASTLGVLWKRHILDGAQLLQHAPVSATSWADVGSGAGLPGLVVACCGQPGVTLIEPRRLRIEFLHKVIDELGLDVEVRPVKVERVEGKFDVISARAVANLSVLLKISAHLSTTNTVWTIPKGRNAAAELAEARKAWQGVFHVKQSVTDPESRIIVATGVAHQ